jgi:hypothetical protein
MCQMRVRLTRVGVQEVAGSVGLAPKQGSRGRFSVRLTKPKARVFHL